MTKKDWCRATKKNLNGASPHFCTLKKGHKGNHICSEGNMEDCGYTWKRKKIKKENK